MNMDEPRVDADIEEDHKRERENLRKQIDQKKQKALIKIAGASAV